LNKNNFKEELKNLPLIPGCYLFKDKTGRVLYVGKARQLRKRVTSYFQKSHHDRPKIELMMDKIASFDIVVTTTEVEALILEKTLIKKYNPPFNSDLRDDKSYPYLAVTVEEEFPRVFVTRELHRRGTLYYGPYTNVRALRTTLDILRSLYPIRTYARARPAGKSRPFLDYHVKWALTPGSVPADAVEYGRIIKKVVAFLEGRDPAVLKDLKHKMQKASGVQEYEKAAAIRDKIEAIEYLMEGQKVVSRNKSDRDVIGITSGDGAVYARILFIRGGKLIGSRGYALDQEQVDEDILGAVIERFYSETTSIPVEILLPEAINEMDVVAAWLSAKRGRKVTISVPTRGEKKNLVEMAAANAKYAFELYRIRGRGGEERATWLLGELKRDLGLTSMPFRVECFDISTLQGAETVASMVVFENGKPRKSEYRRFRVKWVPGQDDFASMVEVLERRLRHVGVDEPGNKFAARPDLLVLDGGKPQLSAAIIAEESLKLRDIPTIALAKREEEIFRPGLDEPLRLPRNSASLNVIRYLRDEAHRFAVSYHRSLRVKTMLASSFDLIPGVGPTKKKALIKHFGSPAGVMDASVEEMAKTPGISMPLAETIFRHLH
jgi:excinuclease ABC subunit C